MAEDCQSDAVPNVARKDFLSDSTTKPGTETVQTLARNPDEDIDLHIPDEQLSIKSDAAAENRQSIDISPGDFDTYAIAYICKDHSTYMKTSLKETKTVATIVASNSSHNDDMNMEGCGASENDSDTSVFIRNDSTAHTETRDPNPMYTRGTMDPPPDDVTPNPMYTQSTMDPSSNEDIPNPMYTQSTMNPSSNEVNPNPMYLQSTTEPSVSPGPTSKSNNSDGNPCSQSSAVTHQQGDEVTFMPANNDGNQCLEPYAVTRQQDGDEEGVIETANIGNSPCLRPYAVKCLKPFRKSTVESASCDATQPYAVRYQEEIANNDSDPYIQPYAVRYQEDDEFPIEVPDCVPAASDSINNDVLTNFSTNDPNIPDLVSDERQHVPNALNRNPMYVPNVQHPAPYGNPTARADRDSGFHRYPWYSWVLQICSHSARCLQQLTAHSSIPTPPAVPNSSQREENDDKMLEPITFGGLASEPGQLYFNHGVAVSADNEIFVADTYNERVQVFSINGTYLRNFTTVVPGGDAILDPHTVAIDVKPGYLWVTGDTMYDTCGYVVQYHKDSGLPIKTFDGRFNPSHEIAIDVRNNQVVLGEGDAVRIYQPNGSLVRSFQVPTDGRIEPIRGITLDREGNVLLVDVHGYVKVYNHSGDKILEFVVSSGRDLSCRGISVDLLGRIIVASTRNNRVDMFTSRGEFVRTVVNMTNPSYIAMGPEGQLVVANSIDSTVTIFPSHVLFP
uniref:SMP-30/Gluconolactonase/LRE-like region domain-containing protein n=1 Tax=Branchiostoma floridae TaxID=7739 RepID=C3Z034_BRAFL|eukprot:XP_002598081.1 hypothetical protein BRAFLDRAFT_85702 [Branchiostoma floridae]